MSRRSYIDILRSHFGAILLSLLIICLSSLYSVFNPRNIQAALIPWDSNASGTGNGFYWQGGGSDKHLFNNPTLIDGHILRFSFDDDDFIAQSSNGKTAMTSDRLQVDIFALDGFSIQGIRIAEQGDYNINLSGQVSAVCGIFLTNLTQYELRKSMVPMTPSMPVSTAGSGSWGGNVTIDELDWTHFRIVLNNNLTAKSQPVAGSDSSINKTSFDLDIIVPEPATVAVFTLGCFVLRFIPRRRRINIRESGGNLMKSLKSKRNFIFFIIILQTLLLCDSLQAFSGSAPHFDWTNGNSALFGDPVLVGDDVLTFSPSDFMAYSENGGDVTVSDTLVFELIADEGWHFEGISIGETGDYEIYYYGSVGVSGNLSVQNMDTSDVLNGVLDNDLEPMPIENNYAAGFWQAWTQVDIEQANWTRLRIVLENTLDASTPALGTDTAWIAKKELGTTIAIQIVPEPATIAVLSFGSLSLIRRKIK